MQILLNLASGGPFSPASVPLICPHHLLSASELSGTRRNLKKKNIKITKDKKGGYVVLGDELRQLEAVYDDL